MLRLVYRLILRAGPPAFRRRYGREMEDLFVQCLATERARRGWAGRVLACVRGLGDALAFALSARWESLRAREYVAPAPTRERHSIVLTQDIRATWRLARHQPWFTAAIVVMLALGIGATTAIFSVVQGVLLEPLPFPDADRLVQVWGSKPDRGWSQVSLTAANFWDLRDMNHSFTELGALHDASFSLTGFELPERLSGGRVSAGFFRSLGVRPVVGRLFESGDDQPGPHESQALLSANLWRRRFGADPGVVGRTMTLDGRPFTVIGVLPAGTPWLNDADVFVPFVQRPNADRDSFEYTVIGRLKPGVTPEAALADLQAVSKILETRYPATNTGLGAALDPSRSWIASDDLRRTLWILLGSVGLLLLIACVNVTNLLLARASARIRENAVRAALGASRSALIRERLTESFLLSGTGAALGLPVTYAMLRVVKSIDPGDIPRLADVTPNGWVFAFAAGIAIVVGVLTGLVPALQAPHADIVPALRHGIRGAGGDRHQARLRQIFVGAEVALSLVLLVGAGLLVRSLTAVLSTDRGFQADHRLLVTVNIPESYGRERLKQIVPEIMSQVQALPEVISAAAVSGRPLSSGSTGLGLGAADRPGGPGATVPWATWRMISSDYFKAMGLPLLRGRNFTDSDQAGKPWRTVISKRAADLLWPGENPIGKTAVLWVGQGDSKAEVVGVVGDMRERGLENEPTLAVYLPVAGTTWTSLQLVIHTRTPPASAVPSIRAAITAMDRNLPVSNARSLDDVISASLATRRLTMLLLATFAGLALALALAGVYGVLAYSVARRTGEIGIRLALGAEYGSVLRHVVVQGMRPVLAGLAVGSAAAFWMSQLMTSLLFAVRPRDPLTYAAVAATVAITAVLACYVPARQVLRVDPAKALKAD